MRYLLPLILAAVLSSTASAQPLETGPAVLGTKPLTLKLVVPKADHCPGCPKAPARVVPVVPVVPYAVPVAPAYRYRVMERTVVRERIVTGERRPVRRVFGRVFGFMGACR